MQTLIRLLIQFKAPVQTIPDNVITPVLQVQPVGGTCGVCKKNIHLAVIPCQLILCSAQDAHTQLCQPQCFEKPRKIMLKVIKDQCGFPAQLFNQLHERLNLAVMHRMRPVLLVVDGAVGKLLQLVRECRCARCRDLLAALQEFQHHRPLHRVICLARLRIQYDGDRILDHRRQLQIVRRLHAHCDVADGVHNSVLCTIFRVVGIDDVTRPLPGGKIPITKA